MSLFTDASLVMIPSGVKDGKLYSIKPDDGVGDFTFTRGSNLAATRVDENGLIEKGRENIILQSNQFDTTWTVNIGASITSGQTGYDGSSNAWLLESINITQSNIGQNVSQTDVQTFSVYAKAGTSNWFAIYVFGTPSNVAWFNLGSGALGLNSNGIDSQIESVGSGWYRCSISFNNTPTRVAIFLSDSDSNVNSSLGANIYIQDAQLELGLVATDYIETGATTEQAGILENLPRLDYTDSSCPSLLLEPTRSNLVTQSEYLASFTVTGGTITTNNLISPDGFVNASTFTENTSTSFHSIRKDVSVSSGTLTFSCFVKGTSRFVSLYPQGAGVAYAIFDLSLVSVTKTGGTAYVSSKIEDYGDGWYRLILTYNVTTGTAFLNVYLSDISSGSGAEARSYLGQGYEMNFYGFQLEAGSYPTSYIPTYGTSVTRSRDLCFGAGDATTFNDSEGVLYAEIAALANDGTFRMMSLSDSSTSDRIVLYFAGDSNKIYAFAASATTPTVDQNYLLSNVVDFNKIAFKYKTNDFSVYANGVEILTDTGGDAPIGLAEFAFDSGSLLYPFYGKIKQIAVFPTALTDSELEALTTI